LLRDHAHAGDLAGDRRSRRDDGWTRSGPWCGQSVRGRHQV